MSRVQRSRHAAVPQEASERPELLLACGVMAFAGILLSLALMVAAAILVQHDFIADTISDLARGPRKWIMDLGFYLNAGALLALAIGTAHFHLGRMAWSLGLFCLAFAALIVVLPGLWDEFHTAAQQSQDMTVHTRLTFALGPLYFAGPLLMAAGASRVARRYGWMFSAAAALWLILATAFKLVPTGYDGILEKAAMTATLLWTVSLAWILTTRGYGRLKERTADGWIEPSPHDTVCPHARRA